MQNVVPVILCGGVGSRLWPLSRERYPKQCLSLDEGSEHTLLQQTLLRFNQGDDVQLAPPIVVCGEEHRFLVAEQVRQVGVTPAATILEPEGRNTASAAAVAAIQARCDGGDPLLLVMPADHRIEPAEELLNALAVALPLVEQGGVAAFGVQASSAQTGYGYIRPGEHSGDGFVIDQFIEKPDDELARQLVADGWLWNSGIFLFRASWYLEQLSQLAPTMVQAAAESVQQADRDLDFLRLNRAAFLRAPVHSIDHLLMEQTAQGFVAPLQAEWCDLGGWQALWEQGSADEQGNHCLGDVYLSGVTDTLVRAESRLVALLGVKDQVVVETSDAVLVAERSRVNELSDLVASLKVAGRKEVIEHPLVYRPWGSYQCLAAGKGFLVKRIVINPGCAISLQRHKHRAEHWVVVSGRGAVHCNDQQMELVANQSTYIPQGAVHRLQNPSEEPLVLIEVQSGDYLSEEDIERFSH